MIRSILSPSACLDAVRVILGKALAKRLGRDFYDADDVIVEQEGKTIPELFAVSEDCFRDAEVRASRTLAAKQGVIIACGGGVIKRPENMAILKKTGKVFLSTVHQMISSPM